MRNRIKQYQEKEKKESAEKEMQELAKDLARAEDEGFAIVKN